MVQFSTILPSFSGLILTSGRMRLHLLNKLGCGAYGVVYLAHDLNASKGAPSHYAVKCLLKHPEESEFHRLQQREIAYHRAASCHPNVVKLHHVIEEEYYLYLVLDHCPGGDLFSAIIDRGDFVNDDTRIKQTFIQLVDAVHTCHDLGIYHRDLKPENILCSEDGANVFVGDFGLATRTRVSANFGCGSSYYMSPECIGKHTCQRPYVTSSSDIWALGVILVNMVTGRNPWHVASPGDDPGFAAYVNEGEPYFRRMLYVSESLSALLARIFTTIPEQRITLNALRFAILQIDTFFPDPEDFQEATRPSALPASVSAAQSVDITDLLSRLDSIGSDEFEIVPIEPLPSPIILKSTGPIIAGLYPHIYPSHTVDRYGGSTRVEAAGSLFSEEYSSASESESGGPITPETHAVNVSTSIPELLLEFPSDPRDLDRGMDLDLPDRDAPDSLTSLSMKKRKLPRSWERLVQRIRVKA